MNRKGTGLDLSRPEKVVVKTAWLFNEDTVPFEDTDSHRSTKKKLCSSSSLGSMTFLASNSLTSPHSGR